MKTHAMLLPVYSKRIVLLPSRLLFIFLLVVIPLFTPDQIAQSKEDHETFPTPILNEFVVALDVEPDSLDPAITIDTNARLVSTQIYDTLFKAETGGTAHDFELLENWSRNADATAWTFDLRRDVKFHDGAPLNAAAVVYNFNRWWDPAHPAHIGSFEDFVNFFGGFKGDTNCNLIAVSQTAEYQFKLYFSYPMYHLPAILINTAFSIASPAAIATGTLAAYPVGSGPFKFSGWIPGESISLLSNTSYWLDPPKLDTLTFQVIADEAERVTALNNGLVHSINNISDYTLNLYLDNTDVQVKWLPSANVGYLGINRAHTPLDNLKVRQAIAHAVDWQALLQTHYTPGDQVATQFLPPVIWGYNPALTTPTYDPALALTLLTEAGYATGFSTTLSLRDVYRAYLPNPIPTAFAIKGYLDAVGIQTTVTPYENITFLSKVGSGDVDLYLLGWGADYGHPDNFYSPHLCDPNYLGLGPIDTVLCDDLQAALAEPNFLQQIVDYGAAAEYIHDSLPFVPIVHARGGLLVNEDVAGLIPSIYGEEYQSVYFADAEQTLVDPALPTTVTYTDPLDQPTTVEIPSGAVTESILMRFEPMQEASLPFVFVDTNHAFTLEAIIDGDVQEDFTFETPVTVTIEYSDADVAFIKDEETLLLYFWDGSAWIDAATSCDPVSAYTRDLVENRLSVDICHLSTFALAGESYLNVFGPIIFK